MAPKGEDFGIVHIQEKISKARETCMDDFLTRMAEAYQRGQDASDLDVNSGMKTLSEAIYLADADPGDGELRFLGHVITETNPDGDHGYSISSIVALELEELPRFIGGRTISEGTLESLDLICPIEQDLMGVHNTIEDFIARISDDGKSMIFKTSDGRYLLLLRHTTSENDPYWTILKKMYLLQMVSYEVKRELQKKKDKVR